MERFWKKVDIRSPDECWLWTAGKKRFGYGAFHRPGHGDIRAHRMAWILARGDIPGGLIVRHRCDNPPCCNPHHLELGTRQDNNRDRVERGRNGAAKRETHGQARLTQADVDYIRRNPERKLQRELAAELGVNQSNISKVMRRDTWSTGQPDKGILPHLNSTLDRDAILAIRSHPEIPTSDLAHRFACSYSTIYRIRTYHSHRHIR